MVTSAFSVSCWTTSTVHCWSTVVPRPPTRRGPTGGGVKGEMFAGRRYHACTNRPMSMLQAETQHSAMRSSKESMPSCAADRSRTCRPDRSPRTAPCRRTVLHLPGGTAGATCSRPVCTGSPASLRLTNAPPTPTARKTTAGTASPGRHPDTVMAKSRSAAIDRTEPQTRSCHAPAHRQLQRAPGGAGTPSTSRGPGRANHSTCVEPVICSPNGCPSWRVNRWLRNPDFSCQYGHSSLHHTTPDPATGNRV